MPKRILVSRIAALAAVLTQEVANCHEIRIVDAETLARERGLFPEQRILEIASCGIIGSVLLEPPKKHARVAKMDGHTKMLLNKRAQNLIRSSQKTRGGRKGKHR